MNSNIEESMKISVKHLESVIKLPGQNRYEYFIKKVSDWEKVWGLFSDGWALTEDDGKVAFPLWPAKEFAALCSKDEWTGYEASSFSLDELLTELIPSLAKDNIHLSIFYTPDDFGVVVDTSKLLNDIARELDKYS
jgi:hypothetical protein